MQAEMSIIPWQEGDNRMSKIPEHLQRASNLIGKIKYNALAIEAKEFIDQALALLAKPCEWKEVGSNLQGMCKTGCGKTYTKQHYEFCPFCGRPIKEIKE